MKKLMSNHIYTSQKVFVQDKETIFGKQLNFILMQSH